MEENTTKQDWVKSKENHIEIRYRNLEPGYDAEETHLDPKIQSNQESNHIEQTSDCYQKWYNREIHITYKTENSTNQIR